MAKIWDWDKIFECFLKEGEFEVRLLFLENEEEKTFELLKKDPFLIEDEIFLKENEFRYQPEKNMLQEEYSENVVMAMENKMPEMIFEEEKARDFYEPFLNVDKVSRMFETFFEIEKTFEIVEEKEKTNILSFEKSFAENAFSHEEKVPWGKREELLEKREEGSDKTNVNMRVEIVKEENAFEYDGDTIAEIVGQKLYEMMQKGAEGFYM